ncbi:SWI/SNF-related matrix-associated actin-dependent regulator of chromatin subfamily A containing DEAD/H box 1 homolog [Drosophila grimshawi]|uniref:SWI/SNF-related matrix-associated actin-dependent regulator of chromatin subfamily A containing DEAD/H box 1 homolog n=1 Tax=Drosophila grimshawi TaxID=7222 RepID=B4JE36_DROGR|nr:SWI/SNF-related matrix-associated actin-dependent regulator of chromatin subfamily A containing DEAD/H box 1 homolog [Drosophila grimshawi]EDW03556.1 GH10438 [Drosophila grimshawi]
MSESPAPSVSKSSLNDLRQFRINRNAAASVSSPGRTERVPGKKRIQVMADSDSDSADCQTPKKPKLLLTVKEKEERYMAAAKIMPLYDTMAIQDSLARSNWDVAAAIRYLKDHCKPKGQHPYEKPKLKHSSNGSGVAKSHSKSSGNYSDCDNSDDDDVKQSKDQVYDSDDSDTEMSTKMTGQRKKVFQFMNSGSIVELQSVKTLSEKKAALLIEIRPFKDWSDLRQKLEANRLSADLLNYAQDLINKQNTVANILSKCNGMVQRLETAIANGAGIVDQPQILGTNLHLADYQIIGLNWLTVMHKQEMNGILADEMGLGKTIQVIAFLAYLKENGLSKGAHLIVVPSSTLDNWEAEMEKWCPSLVVEKYHGSQDERRRMRVRFAKDGFTGFDVLLTTYHIVGSTPEERKMFRVCKLHYVIFDEAHMLKNMTTQRYINLITINAEMRILLTGTPLQNNLLELISLLCFVMPKFFAKSIEDIKTLFAKKSKTDGDQEEFSQFQENQIHRAKRIMKPFVLRRLKKDVLNNLPKKTSYVEKVAMSASQKQYYNDLVEYYSNNKGEICGSSERAGVAIMMEMRRMANHPLLMRHYFSDEQLRGFAKRLARVSSYKKTNEQYIFEELAIMSDFQVYQLCNKYELYDVKIPNNLICDSGKFQFMDDLLPKLKADGHRVLLFSQFTMMLDVVEEYLKIRKHGFCRLDGGTAVKERQDLITDFNVDDNIFVFLLSTKAGGVGINLTAADTCIIHDIDFNPYNDKQAEDRCHRMGQSRPVSIYRLISESTIEEGILMAAEEKLKLEENITSIEKGEVHEQRCVVKLLTMALGLDHDEEEQLNNSLNNSLGTPTK